VQHVDVRHLAAAPRQPVIEVATLEQRRVERLPVEADERAGARELARHRFEQHPLVGVPGEQELPRHERAVVLEPRTADEERERPRAAAEPGRLEVEEHERRPRRCAAGEERRLTRCPFQPIRQRTDPLAAVQRRRIPSAIDDEGAAAPAAAEDRGDVRGRLP